MLLFSLYLWVHRNAAAREYFVQPPLPSCFGNFAKRQRGSSWLAWSVCSLHPACFLYFGDIVLMAPVLMLSHLVTVKEWLCTANVVNRGPCDWLLWFCCDQMIGACEVLLESAIAVMSSPSPELFSLYPLSKNGTSHALPAV
jgi:hypothetical protein